MADLVITSSGAMYYIIREDASFVVVRKHDNQVIFWRDVIVYTASNKNGEDDGKTRIAVVNAKTGVVQMHSTPIVAVEYDVELPEVQLF